MSDEQHAPTMDDLRAHLLGTLADLRNRENPMEPDRARAVAQVAAVLVDSARVEVDFLRATDGKRSKFLRTAEEDERPALPGVRTITHRLR